MNEKRSLFVDTSGWIEVFGRDEPLHKKAREILARTVKGSHQIITTNYIITEFIGNGCKKCKLSREGLFMAVDEIVKLHGMEIVHSDVEMHNEAIIHLRTWSDKEWSLVDATSFNVMHKFGITKALATDHHFEQAGFIKLL